MKYIYQIKNGSYVINKQINGKQVHCGIFHTLEYAKQARKKFIESDWNINYINQYKRCYNKNNHVYKYNNGYVIYKSVNGKTIYYGFYNTKSEAEDRVKFLKKHDWDLKHSKITGRRNYTGNELKYIYKSHDTYQIHKILDGSIYHFGTFNSLEEAKKERDLLIKCNWDYDLLVEQEE